MSTTLTSRLPLRCWAEIDLAALERNLRLIRASLPAHMRYVAVIKADAYGHGLPQTAARLMHAGADLFAVATLAEAAAIREIGPGWPILLLSPLLPEEDRYLADYDLAATVSSAEEVARFDAVGRAAGRPIPVHLKIDTGMGRLGVWHEEAPALWEKIRAASHVRLAGVFTHFASPDDDLAFTAEQRKRFLDALARCPGLPLDDLFVHADNSAGIETMSGAGLFNAVRVGLLQFGILPHPHSLLAQVRTEPVFSFHTRVGLVKKLPRGTTVSYGRTRTLNRDTTVAILCAGYGDGLPRAASNRAQVLVRGRRCAVLGRVTMDQTIIDVTDVPGVAAGDAVVLVGRQEGAEISITEFSGWADTIPWETLCSVTKRVPRLYRTALGV
ncbi:MAG: alanine racemase [Verrucomicrobia bacterium]|nr:alanine racemase [Verrucomicrobiota bacterium]